LKPKLDWPTLLGRLEADLARRARRGENVEPEEPGWADVSAAIAFYSHVVVNRYGGLSPEDMDDVLQAILLKLQTPETLRRLRLAGSPEGYIVVMLRNAAADLLRKRFREREGLERYLLEPRLLAEANEDEIKGARLRVALLSLSPIERALLKMRFWQGMNIAEIAAQTGATYSATAVRMFRILKRLREELT
jgi:RNA polymerase sigma factor (sigma-70 family)